MSDIDFSEYNLIRLSPQYEFKKFDCGDIDLNEFLHQDSIDHLKQLLAVTYILENKEEIIGFYSLMNDKISHQEFSNTRWRKQIEKLFDYETRKRNYKSHPAVKIGRLGVSKSFQSKGVGKYLLDFIKHTFVDNNRTGCRFITLDAYNKPNSLKFYQRNGFVFFTEDDKNKNTRQMFFDLYDFDKE